MVPQPGLHLAAEQICSFVPQLGHLQDQHTPLGQRNASQGCCAKRAHPWCASGPPACPAKTRHDCFHSVSQRTMIYIYIMNKYMACPTNNHIKKHNIVGLTSKAE